jgi:hypothetical protein
MEGLMPVKKLTLSVDAKTIENAKAYSRQHETSVSRPVSTSLAGLPRDESVATPRVRRLTGILPADTSEDEYRGHLDEKHAQ